MPLVAVGIPIARAIAVPMKADTMPTRIVSSMPIGCLPGTSRRPSTPTTMPTRIAVITPVMVMCSPRLWAWRFHTLAEPGINASVNQRARRASYQLRHPQMGDRQLEFAHVEDVRAHLAAARVPHFPRLLPVAFHGVAAVERRCRHRPPGAIQQEAGAAEPLEFFQRGQHVALVELDRPPGLVRRDFDPGDPCARAVVRPVVTMEHPDLPGLGGCGTPENLRRLVTNRPDRLGAGAFGLPGLPRAGSDAPSGFPVDQ